MKKTDVIAHFGGVKKTANALGIWPQAVYKWADTIPDLMQYKIQVVTHGALKADRSAK